MEIKGKHTNTDYLEKDNIAKLLFSYSLPAILAMTAVSFYNIIDRIFIGQGVGPLAISGLAITFPLMNLSAAFGALVSSGASTMISIRLGEKKPASAMRFLGNAFTINIIIGLLLSVFGLIFLDRLLLLFGATTETLPYARDFMQIILIGNIFTHLCIGLNNILRSSGYPVKAMITTLITVVCNLALAPLFIFVFKWGIKGAAWATVIAQIIGTIRVVFHYLDKNNNVYFRKRYLRIKWAICGKIITMGMSSFLVNLCACIVVIIINRSLIKYGSVFAVGAYGIVNSIVSLIVLLVFGFNLGMQPLAGYNYGAKKYDRTLTILKYSLFVATSITTFGFLLGILFPEPLARAFTSDNELIELTVNGMRITVLAFPIVGCQVVASNFFQAVGKPKISIFLSLSRQVLCLIPALLIFPRFFGINGVWYSLPFADLTASIFAIIVLIFNSSKIKKTINISKT